MAAKKAAAKKRSTKAAPKPASKRTGKTSAPKKPGKPSAKKNVKSAKKTSQKKVTKKVPIQKGSSKTTGQKKVKDIPKQPAAPAKPTASTQSPAPAAKPAPAAAAAPTPTAAKRRPSGNLLTGPIRGFSPYQPKRGEEYMSKAQLEHFRQILAAWKRELMEEVDRTMSHMKDDAANFPDPNDRATQESEFGLELRTRDRERKLLKKIDSALSRIDDGSYGFCEETGDEIGLRRLEARPVATLCVEAQERRELAERQFRDREDQYR
jgi:DnaK suppressor protein